MEKKRKCENHKGTQKCVKSKIRWQKEKVFFRKTNPSSAQLFRLSKNKRFTKIHNMNKTPENKKENYL